MCAYVSAVGSWLSELVWSYRLVCGTMPLWCYIDGCPFPQQCGKNKTTTFPRSMKFAGSSMDGAVEKCVYHLMSSSLHTMSKADATRAAREMELHTYEEPTEDEAEDGNARWMCGRNRRHKVEDRNVVGMTLAQARNAPALNSSKARGLPTRG